MSSSDNGAGDQREKDRMAQLETKLAFLEHTVDVLSDEVEAQQSEARTLKKKLDGLHQQLESLQRNAGNSDQPDEPPPHY